MQHFGFLSLRVESRRSRCCARSNRRNSPTCVWSWTVRETGWGPLDSPTNILKSAKERTVLVLSASQFIVDRFGDGSLSYPAKRANLSVGQSSSMIGSPLEKRQIGSCGMRRRDSKDNCWNFAPDN